MNTSWATLAKCVHDRARHVSLGVAVVGPDDSIWAHGGDVTFPSASTAKIPIMVTIYRMLESNTLTLDARRVLQDEHKANGSGVLRHMQSGLQLTIADLLYLMISIR